MVEIDYQGIKINPRGTKSVQIVKELMELTMMNIMERVDLCYFIGKRNLSPTERQERQQLLYEELDRRESKVDNLYKELNEIKRNLEDLNARHKTYK